MFRYFRICGTLRLVSQVAESELDDFVKSRDYEIFYYSRKTENCYEWLIRTEECIDPIDESYCSIERNNDGTLDVFLEIDTENICECELIDDELSLKNL